jgi:hypothetical protein
MTIQRWCHADLNAGVCSRYAFDYRGQVALQVQSQGQEIGHDDNPSRAVFDQPRNCVIERRTDRLQKANFDGEIAGLGGRLRYGPHGRVSRLDARAVGKDYNTCNHAEPWMYARM